MGAGIGAIVQGVSDIASSALGAVFAQSQAKKARRHARNMYQHRYQWTMDDMREAGLNPILAYRQGPGSGTPTVQGGMPNVSRSNYAQIYKQQKMMDAEIFKTEQQGWQAANASALAQEQAATVRRLRDPNVSQATSAAAAARMGLPVKAADEKFYKSKPGEWTRMLQRVLQGVRGAGSN